MRALMLVAMLLAGMAAPVAADDAVVVKALRNPVDKSYRKMVKGMVLFDAMHAMAPEASLRYKLLPRKRDTDMSGIELRIVGDSFELPIALAADQTFTLERQRKALDEDASVRPNRKADSMTWRAEVRTPGLPAHTRRLGDLRLECRVGMEAGLVSHYPSFFGRLMSVLEDPRDFCNERNVPYLFFAERPLFGVTLSAGARKEVLSVGQLYAGIAHGRAPVNELSYCDCEALLDRAYFLPLGERSWPDETLVELEYMDTAAPADEAADAVLGGHSTKADVIAVLGEGRVVHFDNGFEVRAYQFGEQKPRLRETELVVLFDPSGSVAKTRLRPALPPG